MTIHETKCRDVGREQHINKQKAIDESENGEVLCRKACERHQQGDLKAASELYKQAIAKDESLSVAWRNLGALLRQEQRFDEARQCTEKALKLDSTDGSLWGNYGNVLRDEGKLEESCTAFKEGLKRKPDSLGLHQGLAISLGRQKKYKEIIEILTKALDNNEEKKDKKILNEKADILLELGNAFQAVGEENEALRIWEIGINWASGEKKLLIGLNIAQVLCTKKRYIEAESLCEILAKDFNENANITYAQGVIAKGCGKNDEAIRKFEKALHLNAEYPICLNTYGLLLREMGHTHKAKQCFERALKYDRDFGAAMNNLGSVLKDVARYDEALLWLRKGAEALKDNPAAYSNVLFTLSGYELEPSGKRFDEAKRFGERFGCKTYERWKDRVVDPNPKRKLKIGLLSPDFCRHAVSYFVEPLLEQWDKKELEITLFSCGEQIDDYSKRLQEKADKWIDLSNKNDETSLTEIQNCEIDILIDLAGHTAGNRLPLLAEKPAPIQATYLGYYGTTGLKEIDYWITDTVLHPPNQEDKDPCSEERWRLNRCYVCYRPIKNGPKVVKPPAEINGIITFGSFNQSRKITPETASNWMKVLNQITNSKLLLKSKNLGEETEEKRIRAMFEKHGLQKERLELRGHSPNVEMHMETYNEIDIALDTYPYTGCTTTADALWMGVPVLTVAGESMVSRQAAAVLAGINREEWICSSGKEMAEKAIVLTKNIARLKEIRLSQRQRVEQSQLLDHKQLAEILQKSFKAWWHKWLVANNWPLDQMNDNNWTETKKEIERCTPCINSPSLQRRIIIGEMDEETRKLIKDKKLIVKKLKNLSTWGEAIKLFRTNKYEKQVAWLERGITKEESLLWKRTYPQLKWETIEK